MNNIIGCFSDENDFFIKEYNSHNVLKNEFAELFGINKNIINEILKNDEEKANIIYEKVEKYDLRFFHFNNHNFYCRCFSQIFRNTHNHLKTYYKNYVYMFNDNFKSEIINKLNNYFVDIIYYNPCLCNNSKHKQKRKIYNVLIRTLTLKKMINENFKNSLYIRNGYMLKEINNYFRLNENVFNSIIKKFIK